MARRAGWAQLTALSFHWFAGLCRCRHSAGFLQIHPRRVSTILSKTVDLPVPGTPATTMSLLNLPCVQFFGCGALAAVLLFPQLLAGRRCLARARRCN